MRPLEKAAYAHAGGNDRKGVKLEAMEGSQAVRKRTNSRRRLLYRLLGGRLVLGLITHYKIPKRTGEIPRVIGGGSQLLVESPWAFRPGFWDKYWKTGVEAWISRHVELYYITTCLPDSLDARTAFRLPLHL